MSAAWVLGAGGLLGGSLVRELRSQGTACFQPAAPFTWREPVRLQTQLKQAVEDFAAHVAQRDEMSCAASPTGADWEIWWAAGRGAMSSQTEELATETRALACVLEAISSSAILGARAGRLALMSSAGAIYAGSASGVIDEHSPVAPTSPYAAAKLDQEALVRDFVRKAPRHAGLVARCSTLYGSGQTRDKPQGLLTFIARSLMRNAPIPIFVPLDTMRDYLSADDAARMIVESLRTATHPGQTCVRIIASETPVTIAEIIAIFQRVSRRRLRVVTSTSAVTGLYASRIRFRSRIRPVESMAANTPLAAGIASLLHAERLALARCQQQAPDGQ